MSDNERRIIAKTLWLEDKQAYCCLVYECEGDLEPNEFVVLNVGLELSKPAAQAWCDKAFEAAVENRDGSGKGIYREQAH